MWVCMAAAIGAGQQRLAAQDRHAGPIAAVDVLLTTAPSLSEAARVAMMHEAAAIWEQQGVTIEWSLPTAVRPTAPDRLRVLVVQKRPIVSKWYEPFAVGELVRASNSHPVALIWIESAQRLVSRVKGRAGYEPIAIDERRLGVVLGRALAHEIGHYLLDTPTHARSGLMRPNFNAVEFTELRDDTFALDADAATWLRTRDVEKFAYAHR